MVKLMTLLNPHRPQILSNQAQSGQAAFAVTLIIMLVLSLIVLGYANNARNEQRRVLDDQLSTAAYYTAESGVNDAYAIIKADIANGLPVVAQTSCSSATTPYSTHNSFSGTSDVYTCLLVSPTPSSLDYVPIDTGHGQVAPLFGINPNSGVDELINSITISWQEDGVANPQFNACPPGTQDTFSPEDTWTGASCNAGVLQIDLVPAFGWSTQSNLQADTQTVYLEPQQGNENNGPQKPVNGSILKGNCGSNSTGEYKCTVVLNNLPPSSADPTCLSGGCYYLHIVPIYQNADVSVTVSNSATGDSTGQLDLKNGQVVIDSTGKASDELKRIQERVSIDPLGDNDVPVNALQIQSGICKHFTTRPGSTTGSTDSC
jgi:hypothetical protein